MKKKDIARIIAQETNMTIKKADLAISVLLDVVTDALNNGEEIKINGFGKWLTYESKPRNGVNPQTKESILIPASNRVKFIPSKVLKNLVKERD
jgi:DNA-binding protein HU-beta